MAARLVLVSLLAATLVGCGKGTDPKTEAAAKMRAAGEGPKKPKSGDFE